MYTIYIKQGIVVRDSDGLQIIPSLNPNNPNTVENIEYMEWVKKGNAPSQNLRDPAEIIIGRAKEARNKLLKELTVTVDDLVFDSDDLSQARMNIAIQTLRDNETTLWIMADNSLKPVTKDVLQQALRSAWVRTSEICIAPRLSTTVSPIPTPTGGVRA